MRVLPNSPSQKSKISDSPLLKAGAKFAPLRGARAVRPAICRSRVNNNLLHTPLGQIYETPPDAGNGIRGHLIYSCFLLKIGILIAKQITLMETAIRSDGI